VIITNPRTIQKPWGREVWFAHTHLYAGKMLYVNAGEQLSVQYHQVKDEASYVLSGTIRVTWSDESIVLKAGDAWRIIPGIVHSLEAVTDAVIVEVSTPHLDDVVRVSDVYGRAAA
jgi:mannose-6-phosphate isomerase